MISVKVGDKLRIIEKGELTDNVGISLGDIVMLIDIDRDDDELPYLCKFGDDTYWCSYDEVESVNIILIGGE